MQPKIRLPNRIRTHLLTPLLVLPLIIRNPPIRNRMHNMHALLAHFPCQRLSKLPHRRSTGAICRKLRTTAQRAQRARED